MSNFKCISSVMRVEQKKILGKSYFLDETGFFLNYLSLNDDVTACTFSIINEYTSTSMMKPYVWHDSCYSAKNDGLG